jgi:hypothetical protein
MLGAALVELTNAVTVILSSIWEKADVLGRGL